MLEIKEETNGMAPYSVHEKLANSAKVGYRIARSALASIVQVTTEKTSTTIDFLQKNDTTTAASTHKPIVTALNSTYSSTNQTTVNNEQICPPPFEDFVLPQDTVYCNWTWDKILCWPPTTAGTIAKLRCPIGHGIDVTKFAERKCGLDGRWLSKPGIDQQNSNGWTNYTPCYTPEILDLMKKMYSGGNGDVIKIKFEVVERTRTLEIIGLIISLCALLLSLIIFYNFRTLRNSRTKIHKNLFIAMVIQVIIRLTLYLDQAFIRPNNNIGGHTNTRGIENTPYLCEASYVLLEYARTAMFMWMFIEGLYLHNVVTVTVFQGRFPRTVYAIIGWGVPIIMTAIWAIVTAQYKSNEKCWWNYNLTPYYWILEGPRLAVITFNFFFLLNIIRVLIVKLRQSQTSEVEQVRKAVRAAFVLLPLLGITNAINMFEAPLNRTPLEFAVWSYVTHFLTSFQGLFIAMIYCFLNGEVRAAILKSITVYMSLRGHTDWPPRRGSMFSAAYNTAPDTEGNMNESIRQEPLSHRRSICNNNSKKNNKRSNSRWMLSLCFRGQKNKCVMPNDILPTKIIMTSRTIV